MDLVGGAQPVGAVKLRFGIERSISYEKGRSS